MGVFVSVNDAERVLAARRQEKIVSAHNVLYDSKYDVATIRSQCIVGRQVDMAGLVQRASRDNLLYICCIGRQKI